MPIIKVAKRFVLKDDNDQLVEYHPGEYDVDDWVAEHWYTKAFLEGYAAPPPPPGTYAQAELRVAQAARIGAPLPAAEPEPEVQWPGKEVRFAGRELPKEPDQLQGFTDPRTIDPRNPKTAKR